MAVKPDPKKLTVDYQKLLKLSVSERVKMAQSSQGQSYLASLTAGEYAALFPDYYKKQVPAYGKLASASPTVSLSQAGSGSTPGMSTNRPSSSGQDTSTSKSPGGGSTPQTGRQNPEPNRPNTWLGKLEQINGVSRPQSSPNISTSPGGHPVLAQERAKYFEELDKDPALKATVQSLIMKENSKHPAGPLEALMNRASRDGKSIRTLVYNGFFGPINRGEVSPLTNKKSIEESQRAFDQVRGGSNDIELRTDQGFKNEHKWADSVAGQGRGRKKEIRGEWYSDQNPKSEAWVKRIEGQIKSYDDNLERPKPGNLGTEKTTGLGVDAERNSKTTRLFFDEEKPYTKEEHDALVKRYGADNISVGGFEHKYLEGRGGPTNEKWTPDERARVEARAKALGMSFEQYRNSGFWRDVEKDIQIHSKNGGKTHEIDNLGINGANALDETVKHLEWLKENNVKSKLLLKNLDDKQILELAKRFPEYKNHVIGGFTEADTGSYRSQDERVNAISKAYKEIGLTSTFAPDVKASEKYRTPGDRYGGAILRVEGLVKPGSVQPALVSTPAPPLPEGLKQSILDEYNSLKTDEDKNYFRHMVSKAMTEKKMTVESLNKSLDTEQPSAQPVKTVDSKNITNNMKETSSNSVDDYLFAAYKRVPNKSDSTGDFTWKDYASALRRSDRESFNKIEKQLNSTRNSSDKLNLLKQYTSENMLKDYVVGGINKNFKEQLYAAGKDLDKKGVGWTISAAFRDDYRQGLITDGVRARVGHSKHGGSHATGGYGDGRAIDINPTGQASYSSLDPSLRKYGLGRHLGDKDPPHVEGLNDKLADNLRTQRIAEEARVATPVIEPAIPVQPQSPIPPAQQTQAPAPTATPASGPAVPVQPQSPIPSAAPVSTPAAPAPAPAAPAPTATPEAKKEEAPVPAGTPKSKHGGDIQAEGDNAYIVNRSGKILSSVNPEKESINLDKGRIKVNPLNRTNPDELQVKTQQQMAQRIQQANEKLDSDAKGAMTPARPVQQNHNNPNHQKMMEEDANRSGKTFLSPSAERAFASHRFFDNSRGGHYAFGTSTLKLV